MPANLSGCSDAIRVKTYDELDLLERIHLVSYFDRIGGKSRGNALGHGYIE